MTPKDQPKQQPSGSQRPRNQQKPNALCLLNNRLPPAQVSNNLVQRYAVLLAAPN